MKQIEKYEPKIHERVWGQEIFIAETEHYLGKMLVMKAGTAGGLQAHVEKDETFYLLSGEAWVASDVNGKGEKLWYRRMTAGQAWHIPPGAAHKVEAITDCVFFEASTPHYDDRIRLEKQYGLPVPEGEEELQSTWEMSAGGQWEPQEGD